MNEPTVAAYALNMLHGAQLADFEKENLIALCEKLGVKITKEHTALQIAKDVREQAVKALRVEVENLRDIVAQCRDQFRRYESLHALKPDGTGQEKAKVNGAFADRCDAVLKKASV